MMRVLAPLGQIRQTSRSASSSIELTTAGARYAFDVRWAGEGFPEDVRRALATLPDTAQGSTQPITVVAARRLSVGARKLLRGRHINWVDESGAAWIVAPPGLLVDRAGQPPAPSHPSPSPGWSAGSASLGEVVLASATREATGGLNLSTTRLHALPTASVLARRAGVSVSSVNTTLRTWAEQGWIEKRGGQRGPTSTRLLVAPEGLLNSWAAWAASTPVSELAIDADFTDAITWVKTHLATVMPRKGTWCLGGLVASALVAPRQAAVSRVLCHVEVSVFDLLCDSLGRSGAGPTAAGGEHLLLRSAHRSTVNLADPQPVPLASPPRIYADLIAEFGADSEAATDFRELAFGF